MTKEVVIGMLKVAKNGNDLLSILDALNDSQDEKVTPLAVDFRGNAADF